jgi:hypothetical protein
MCGKGSLFGGASQQETNIANSTQQFNQQLQGNYAANYNKQSNVISQYGNDVNELANGTLPSVQGWSPAEAAAVNTQAINNAGAQARNIEQAVNTSGARGGGPSSGLQSGVQQALNESAASQVANNLSATQNANTVANYNAGRAQQVAGIEGLGTEAGLLNPNAIASEANTAGGQAFGEANTVNQQNNQAAANIAGLVTSAAGAAVGLPGLGGGFGGGGGMSGGGSGQGNSWQVADEFGE